MTAASCSSGNDASDQLTSTPAPLWQDIAFDVLAESGRRDQAQGAKHEGRRFPTRRRLGFPEAQSDCTRQGLLPRPVGDASTRLKSVKEVPYARLVVSAVSGALAQRNVMKESSPAGGG